MLCILRLDNVFVLFFRQDTDYYNISHFPLEQYTAVIVKPGGINACSDHGVRRSHWPAKLEVTTGPEKTRSNTVRTVLPVPPVAKTVRGRHERTSESTGCFTSLSHVQL
jgi:hypothetical protein